MVIVFTQPLTKLILEDISGGKARLTRKADNLITIYELTV
jgi:hypothetical protein